MKVYIVTRAEAYWTEDYEYSHWVVDNKQNDILKVFLTKKGALNYIRNHCDTSPKKDKLLMTMSDIMWKYVYFITESTMTL